MPLVTTPDEIQDILTRYRRVAVVGLSDRPNRPSYQVAAYLQAHGYEITPVNPTLTGRQVLGRSVYGSLAELPEPPEIVDVFRRSQYVASVVEEAIAVGARVLWTQLGVRDAAAARRASDAGMLVVQDRCMEIDHARLGARLR